MLELTIILDSNARNPFFYYFLCSATFRANEMMRSEREGGTRSQWTTLRNWNWTLRGLCGYLVCLTDAAVPALFPLPALPEQSTPRIAVRSSITAHTQTREKRKLTKAMRMLLLWWLTLLLCSLSLSRCLFCLAVCCPIGNWHKMTRTPTQRTLWQRRTLLLLSENVCTFPIGMQHRMPMREWFHRRAAQKGGTTTHKMKLRLHTE